MSQAKFDELRGRLAEISDLGKTAALLGWDQQVMMPRRGASIRAEQLATVGRIAHQKFTSAEVGKLLDDLRDWGEQHEYDSFEASLVRVTSRDWEKASKVPSDLRAEMSRSAALANQVWIDARSENDFAKFLPVLRKNLDLRKRYIDCFEVGDEPYDIVLDDYERNMKTAEVRRIFDHLKEHQAPLVKEIASYAQIDKPAKNLPVEPQKAFELEIVREFGFTDDAWRLDPTVHPFASGTGITDIRITTRYFKEHLGGLFGTMHEFGHGLYEHQIDPSLERSPLARGVSLGMHESQSRMWENLVGRSLPFWRRFFPRLQQHFPDDYAGYDAESIYREVNAVEPSLIRVEADEATYNLHIILRFELEQELIDERLAVRDLPGAWNARMEEYLGVDVPDDARGVLQDMHWAGGGFGYFPTYSLGNVISVQIWERLKEELGDVDERFERGEFGEVREWLRDHLYRMGRKFTPQETIERVTGSPIDAKPYVRYLREKLAPQAV
ncbi:MAG: carboxypeptidase M32 [Gaiellaceae bacterium]